MTIKVGDKVRIKDEAVFFTADRDYLKNRRRRADQEVGTVSWVSPSVNQYEVQFDGGSTVLPNHKIQLVEAVIVESPFKLGDTVVIKGPVLSTDGRETDRIVRNKYEGKITQLFPSSAWVRFHHPYGDAMFYGVELPFDRLQIRDFPKEEPKSDPILTEKLEKIEVEIEFHEHHRNVAQRAKTNAETEIADREAKLASLTRIKKALEAIQ